MTGKAVPTTAVTLGQSLTIARRARAFRIPWVPALPIFVIVAALVIAIFAPVVAPHDPLRQSLMDSLLPPAFVDGGTPEYLLGTDNFGRDVLSRLIYGARITLTVSSLVILTGATIGVLVGTVAGYYGGWFDSLLMRLTDIILSFPLILIAIVLVTAIGASIQNVIGIVAFLLWPRFARMVRSEALTLSKQDFITLARIAGISDFRILFRHILPNVIPTLIVLCTLEVGAVIVLEASLSFLGVGVPPPEPSWGVMVNDGRGQIASGWWIALFPGIAIMVLVLSLNVFGDWLRDVLDPRSQRV